MYGLGWGIYGLRMKGLEDFRARQGILYFGEFKNPEKHTAKY
jgi:hypothetical protein